MPKFELTYFLLGCGGGLLPDVLRLIKNRYEPFEKIYGSANFWVGLLFLVGLGGLCAWLGSATDFKTALAFGYGAPEFISKLASASGGAGTPPTTGRQSAVPPAKMSFSLLHWWKG